MEASRNQKMRYVAASGSGPLRYATHFLICPLTAFTIAAAFITSTLNAARSHVLGRALAGLPESPDP